MLVALGMTIVIATGGIDLSVGSVIAISGATACLLISHLDNESDGKGVVIAVAAALGLSMALGLWNGILVAVIGIQPIIATLILMVSGRGIAQLITSGQIITINSHPYAQIGGGYWLTLPISLFIAAAMYAVTALVSRKSALGMLIESVGGNAEASRLAGVRSREPDHARVRLLRSLRRDRRPDAQLRDQGRRREQRGPVVRARRDPRRRHRRHRSRRRSLLPRRDARRRDPDPDAGDDDLLDRHSAGDDAALQGPRRDDRLPHAVARVPHARCSARRGRHPHGEAAADAAEPPQEQHIEVPA